MIINPTIEPHLVDDYEICFTAGFVVPITIDRQAGDSVDFNSDPLAIKVYKAPKATIDSDFKTPAESTTYFYQHIASITHRQREVTPATPEQRDAFRNTLHKLSTTIQ